MKIAIGNIFQFSVPARVGIELPGIGIIESTNVPTKEDMFNYVVLNRKQLLRLKQEIEKELANERETDVQ